VPLEVSAEVESAPRDAAAENVAPAPARVPPIEVVPWSAVVPFASNVRVESVPDVLSAPPNKALAPVSDDEATVCASETFELAPSVVNDALVAWMALTSALHPSAAA
jgi:hypothetical protein